MNKFYLMRVGRSDIFLKKKRKKREKSELSQAIQIDPFFYPFPKGLGLHLDFITSRAKINKHASKEKRLNR